jgi:hypothetical protein
MRIFYIAALLLLAGCKQYYLCLCQEWVDVRYLASTHVGTPDPRQLNPPLGQKLIIDWRVPGEILQKKPEVVLHLILWDYTTRTVRFPIKRRMDYASYKLINEEYEKSGGILTFKAEIVTEDGQVYREWKHQLWVNLITIDQEMPASAEENTRSAE